MLSLTESIPDPCRSHFTGIRIGDQLPKKRFIKVLVIQRWLRYVVTTKAKDPDGKALQNEIPISSSCPQNILLKFKLGL